MKVGHPSGTFNATPVAVAAALETIRQLETPGTYEKFQALGDRLANGLTETGKSSALKFMLLRTVPSVSFKPASITPSKISETALLT